MFESFFKSKEYTPKQQLIKNFDRLFAQLQNQIPRSGRMTCYVEGEIGGTPVRLSRYYAGETGGQTRLLSVPSASEGVDTFAINPPRHARA